MFFCKCGKLPEKTDFGYMCVCGLKYDFEFKPISEEEMNEKSKAEAKRKKRISYRFRYPNMGDDVNDRKAVSVSESEYFKGME